MQDADRVRLGQLIHQCIEAIDQAANRDFTADQLVVRIGSDWRRSA